MFLVPSKSSVSKIGYREDGFIYVFLLELSLFETDVFHDSWFTNVLIFAFFIVHFMLGFLEEHVRETDDDIFVIQ